MAALPEPLRLRLPPRVPLPAVFETRAPPSYSAGLPGRFDRGAVTALDARSGLRPLSSAIAAISVRHRLDLTCVSLSQYQTREADSFSNNWMRCQLKIKNDNKTSALWVVWSNVTTVKEHMKHLMAGISALRHNNDSSSYLLLLSEPMVNKVVCSYAFSGVFAFVIVFCFLNGSSPSFLKFLCEWKQVHWAW